MYRWGMGVTAADQPDVFTPEEIAALVSPVGPDAGVVAPLQVGALAQQVSSSGQYSINPATGQLQQNLIAGVSNTTLLYWGGGIFLLVIALGAFAGGRRR